VTVLDREDLPVNGAGDHRRSSPRPADRECWGGGGGGGLEPVGQRIRPMQRFDGQGGKSDLREPKVIARVFPAADITRQAGWRNTEMIISWQGREVVAPTSVDEFCRRVAVPSKTPSCRDTV